MNGIINVKKKLNAQLYRLYACITFISYVSSCYRVIEHIICTLSCYSAIICVTDNSHGENFNDFSYRNKFVIYLCPQGKRKTRGSINELFPLSVTHTKWSFNVVLRFVPFFLQIFLLCTCLYME